MFPDSRDIEKGHAAFFLLVASTGEGGRQRKNVNPVKNVWQRGEIGGHASRALENARRARANKRDAAEYHASFSLVFAKRRREIRHRRAEPSIDYRSAIVTSIDRRLFNALGDSIIIVIELLLLLRGCPLRWIDGIRSQRAALFQKVLPLTAKRKQQRPGTAVSSYVCSNRNDAYAFRRLYVFLRNVAAISCTIGFFFLEKKKKKKVGWPSERVD